RSSASGAAATSATSSTTADADRGALLHQQPVPRLRAPGRRGRGLTPDPPPFLSNPGPWGVSDDARGRDYDRRFADVAATGADMHGEATFVESLGVRNVLDAGCGTGRVAIELARRGLDVVGLDADPGMLSAARDKAPELEWVEGDLSAFDLLAADGRSRRRFDAAV